MLEITVAAGRKIVVADGSGNVRTYIGGETVSIAAADAKKFIDAGLCTEAE